MSEYQVKLGALKTYEDALRLRKLYREAVEVNSGLLREIIVYYEGNGLEIPEREKVNRLIAKLVEMLGTVSDGSFQKKSQHGSDEDFPAPATATQQDLYL